MQMTNKEFDQELRYQITTYFVRKMLEQGLITEDEYHRIDAANCEKYQPITGSLLSGKSLICSSIRANIRVEKEVSGNESNTKNRAQTT